MMPTVFEGCCAREMVTIDGKRVFVALRKMGYKKEKG